MYVNMNFGSVRSAHVKPWGGGGGLYSRLIAYSNISPPLHFRLVVVYKMGGCINGTLWYIACNMQYANLLYCDSSNAYTL